MPLHVWLPGAHANAPSHVSALMSGVLIKIGIYGIAAHLLASSTVPPLGWGDRAPRRRHRLGRARRGVRARPARSQATARVPQRREHRDHRHGARPRAARAGASAVRRSWSSASPARLLHVWNHAALQGAAVPQRRLGAARDRHARDRPPRRPRPAHAAHGAGVPLRRRRHLRPAAAERLRERVARLPRVLPHAGHGELGVPAQSPPPRSRSSARSRVACFVKAFGAVFLGTARSRRRERSRAGRTDARCPWPRSRSRVRSSASRPAARRARARRRDRGLGARARDGRPVAGGPRAAARAQRPGLMLLLLTVAIGALLAAPAPARRPSPPVPPGTAATPRPRRACSTRRRRSPRCSSASSPGRCVRCPARVARRPLPGCRRDSRATSPTRSSTAPPAVSRAAARAPSAGSDGSSTATSTLYLVYVLGSAGRPASGGTLSDEPRRRPPRARHPAARPRAGCAAAARGRHREDEGASRRAASGRRSCSPTTTSRSSCARGPSSARTTTWVFRAGPVVGRRDGARSRRCSSRSAGTRPRSSVHRRHGRLRLPLRRSARFFTVAAALDTGSRVRGDGRRPARSRSPASPSRRSSSACSSCARVRRRSRCRACSGSTHRRGLERRRAPSLVARRRRARSSSSSPRTAACPFDDPNTHLELTMIHEVMVLDHSGPAFGLDPLRRGAQALRLRALIVVGSSSRSRSGIVLARPGALRGRACSVVGVVDRRRRVDDGAAPAVRRSRACSSPRACSPASPSSWS